VLEGFKPTSKIVIPPLLISIYWIMGLYHLIVKAINTSTYDNGELSVR